MKKVFICSVGKAIYAADIKTNIYCRFAAEQNCLPIAPRAIFSQFLAVRVKDEQKLSIDMGLELMRQCKELWVFGYKFTKEMGKELAFAKKLGLPIRRFNSDMEELK